MRILVIALTLSLAACGVGGEPERPERAQVQTGLSITGTASVGIVGRN